jgi:adenosine deaminase
MERMENRTIPDHYYRLNQEKSLKEIESLGELIRIGLYRIAKSHLELRENRIYVKQDKQNDWQELITYIPPLVLQATFLHIERPITDDNLLSYFQETILPNTKYTALPYPYIPQIENYIREKNGLHDLHLHLNGSVETDVAWQDFLFAPDQVYKDLTENYNNPKVREQYEQESLESPLEFKDLLLCARAIRLFLFKMIVLKKVVIKKDENDNFEIKSPEHLLKLVLDAKDPIFNEQNPFTYNHLNHPFADLVWDDKYDRNKLLSVECLMYLLVFRYLEENPKESVASMFHFYLLILGLSNRLLVQQKHQFGFEQFQKLTLNELRTNSEKTYLRRFLQLHGNEQRNIRFLEGRFSPKKTRDKNMQLIRSIEKGWEILSKRIKYELNISEELLPQLKLVAHFIKEEDRKPDEQIRHKKLRFEVWDKAKVLALLKQNHTEYTKNIVAVDAAASEFDAPPEVFAPAFRYLRRKGFNHFTYHAGEDFFHIISGLRAIYEAVEFHELKQGDRIGHATATGVSPEVWIRNIGQKMFIKQGEYMDNLLFAYHHIIEEDIELLKNNLPLIVNKIQELSNQIYQKYYSLATLEGAWLLRRFCPATLLSSSKSEAEIHSVFDDDEWRDIQKEIHNNLKDERIEVLRKYHCKEYKKRYDEIIEVKVCDYLDIQAIELLQLTTLKFLHKKEIVIETLPTSNIRIGHHSDFETYHLWRWIEWEKEGYPIPPIVVGVDDAGIFATNIYNEYANIYCHLICKYKMTHNSAMDLIERLDKNGQRYKFG